MTGIPDPPRSVAAEPWQYAGLGNHRAIVTVDEPAYAVVARIPWRRRDRHPERVQVRVFELATGREVGNVYPRRMSREVGEIVFEAGGRGEYALYYLPFDIGGKAWYAPHVRYRQPDESGLDPAWRARAGRPDLPTARLERIEARTEMDRFDPMEVIATQGEVAALLDKHGQAAFLLFPEDRARPIRMTDDLPLHWVQGGPRAELHSAARPHEYVTFQLGLYARQDLANVAVEADDLVNEAGARIPAAALTCLNTGGTDWLGRDFTKPLAAPAGTVQPLWIGVDIPATAQGCFTGPVRVRATGVPAQTIMVHLECGGEPLADRGDGELWRQARLRWLNSTIGFDDEPAAGYPALAVQGNELSCLGRRVTFAAGGLPESIRSYFAPSVSTLAPTPTEVLARPIALVAKTASGTQAWQARPVEIQQVGPGAVAVRGESQAEGLRLQATTRMEFDGHMDVRLVLTATQECKLADLALEIPLRAEVARLMMGLGRKGGARPERWHYEWDLDRSNHHLWLGTVNAGLHVKLKHDEDVWDLSNLHASGFPVGWHNGGQGGCDVVEEGGAVVIRAYTGSRHLQAGERLSLRCSLLPTPLKLLDLRAHWGQRYYHIDSWEGRIPDLAEAKQAGATVVNLHQGGRLNPYINYPFRLPNEMRAETAAAHAAGLRYKLYYTVRELSHMAAEIWAFRSLNGEIYQEQGAAAIADQFADTEERDDVAGGTGGPWLREHLVGRYVPAWQQRLPGGEMDQAIATAGLSRLHNYYLEGLRYLVTELGMDGLYLDGVGYDRQIMKRVRKAMDRARPGCLIDFHSGNNFHLAYGMNNVLSMYMELLPYVDSLWIGEGFDYNESPDYYLTEICGLPFGLPNDMLQGGGNPWRGMVYGMTCRYGWQQGGDPRAIWRLWREFGIERAAMLGYWHPDCPVRTGHPDVLATAYVKPDGSYLIALASWAAEPVECRLEIGGEPRPLRAPAVAGLQEEREFPAGDPVPVEPAKGWLLLGATA